MAMDLNNLKFKEEIVISPMYDLTINNYVANANFEADYTKEQYNEVIKLTNAQNVNAEQDMAVYFDATISNIYGASMEINITAGLIYNNGSEYIKLPPFTQQEKEKIVYAMDAYCTETAREGIESSHLVDIMSEAKEAALEEAALDAPNRGYIEENDIFNTALIEPIRDDDFPDNNSTDILALNIYLDDAILNELAIRTPIYKESGVKSYNELVDNTDITMYVIASYENENSIPQLLLVRESEELGFTDYNIPLSEEEKLVVKNSLYKHIADHNLSLEERFNDILFAMEYAVKATTDYIAEYKGIDDVELSKLCAIVNDDPQNYSSLADFAKTYPYVVTEIYNPSDDLPFKGAVYDGIQSFASTAYGISDNLQSQIMRYFRDGIIEDVNDVNTYEPNAIKVALTSESNYSDIIEYGKQLKQGSEREQSFYRVHEFDFKAIELIENNINDIDMTRVAPAQHTITEIETMYNSNNFVPVHASEAYKMWLDGFNLNINGNDIEPYRREEFESVEDGDFIHISLEPMDKDASEELHNHFKMNGYSVKWDKDNEGFTTTKDEIDYIDVILHDSGLNGYGKEDLENITPTKYANLVQEDVSSKLIEQLKDPSVVITAPAEDVQQYKEIDRISLSLACISPQIMEKGVLQTYSEYNSSPNSNFKWNDTSNIYNNIENALVQKDIYFIQKIIDDALVYNPSVVSELTKEQGLYSLSDIKDAILSYRDAYVVKSTPAEPKITITCDMSESVAFETGKTYSVSEFDSIMLHEDKEKKRVFDECKEKYGNYENWRDAYDKDPQNVPYPSAYEKVRFTINFPDGRTLSERQDIGDGNGGVIDFLRKFDIPEYKSAAVQMNKQAYKEYVDFQSEVHDKELLTPHTYVHSSENSKKGEGARYTVLSIPTDSQYPNDDSSFHSAQQAHTYAHIQLENALDKNSLAPKEDKIDGYAIFDLKKHIVIEKAGNIRLEDHFSEKVLKDTAKAEKTDQKSVLKPNKNSQEQRE